MTIAVVRSRLKVTQRNSVREIASIEGGYLVSFSVVSIGQTGNGQIAPLNGIFGFGLVFPGSYFGEAADGFGT